MYSFSELSVTARGVLLLWTLLLNGLSLWNILQSLAQKKKSYAAGSAVTLVLSYLMLQAALDYGTRNQFGVSGLGTLLGQAKALWWLIAILCLTGVCVFLTVFYARWGKSHVTVMSVKDGMDKLQAGLCYWKENGQIILSNRKMNALCLELTGESLLNGSLFYRMVLERGEGERITMLDGTIRQFRHGMVNFHGERIHELISTDVTEFCQKNEELRQEAESLRKMNEKLQRYHQNIEEMVRQQEILQAKERIHDEMNKLMLLTSVHADEISVRRDESTGAAKESTGKTEESAPGELDKAFLAWKDHVRLLDGSAGRASADPGMTDLERLAKLLDIQMIISDDAVSKLSPEHGEILRITLSEAMANAIKHAQAKKVEVSVFRDDQRVEILITNDGFVPEGPVTEGGGLSNVRRRVEMAGGRLEILWEGGFALKMILPK